MGTFMKLNKHKHNLSSHNDKCTFWIDAMIYRIMIHAIES
jgi:hypothetical protein